MNDWITTLPKVELHCHCDGCVDPAMLRSLTSAQESFDATAAELELSYPVTSLDKWATVYEPVLTGFWRSTASSLSRVALCQYERWCAQNVQYAELFISRILGALDGEPLREWFRALAHDLQHSPGRCVVKPVVCLSRDKVVRHQQKILELASAGLIVGVALAGNEFVCPIRDIRQPLELFRAAGLGIEIHAGEFGGPDTVWDALEHRSRNVLPFAGTDAVSLPGPDARCVQPHSAGLDVTIALPSV